MSATQRISDIIAASILGSLDPKGEQELNEWLSENQANRDFYESVKNILSDEKKLLELSSYDSVRDWVRVKQKVAENRRRRLYRRSLYAAAGVAACALVLFGVLLIPRADTPAVVDSMVAQAAPDTADQANYKALLVLPDGDAHDLANRIDLDEGKIQNDGAELRYDSSFLKEPQESGPEIHTVKVPRGAEYKIRLADGTIVHLNADSELRYPTYFDGENRTVELTGEAYFDVASDAGRPFVIENREMSLTVLGTSFNFRAYNGEQRRVTVESGRVLVSLGNMQMEAGPGIQVCETDNGLYLREVNTSTCIAWRDNRFCFSSENLGNVLMEIGRWYDVEVSFSDDKLKELRFTADLPRYDNITKITDLINQAVSVHILLNENKLVIMSENNRSDL